MNQIPEWVDLGEGAKIADTVLFIPWNKEKTFIGKRVKIDSGSVIHGGVSLGNDCIIGHNTIIRFNTHVGTHSVIANLCMIEGNITVGEHTLIHSNNHIGQKTSIGNYVFMAPLCVTTNDPGMYFYRKEYSPSGAHWHLLQGPTIKDGARIAAGVTILPKISIGTHAVIGGGSVVTKDVPDYAIAFGNPAQIRRYVDPDTDLIVSCTKQHL